MEGLNNVKGSLAESKERLLRPQIVNMCGGDFAKSQSKNELQSLDDRTASSAPAPACDPQARCCLAGAGPPAVAGRRPPAPRRRGRSWSSPSAPRLAHYVGKGSLAFQHITKFPATRQANTLNQRLYELRGSSSVAGVFLPAFMHRDVLGQPFYEL